MQAIDKQKIMDNIRVIIFKIVKEKYLKNLIMLNQLLNLKLNMIGEFIKKNKD
jgi:hypothetical protein